MNKTKFLLNEREYQALLDSKIPNAWIETAIWNDPDWGYTGSGECYVITMSHTLTTNDIIWLGQEIERANAKKQLSHEN